MNLVKDKIRILETYISYNKQLADQYNFVNVTTDTKSILIKYLEVARAIASRKNSSPQSISMVKSCVYLHNETLIKPKTIRKPKIKHTSLTGNYSEGSMKDIDIKA